jgi:hypothetical protein
MESRTKAMILGGILGTVFVGPGYGTILGAALAGREHDRQNGNVPPYDDDEHKDRDVP